MEKDHNSHNLGHLPKDIAAEDSENSRNSDAIKPLPSDGTPLSSALPSPAWSRKPRRRRAPVAEAVIPRCERDSSWPDKKCDYDFSWSGKKSIVGIPLA